MPAMFVIRRTSKCEGSKFVRPTAQPESGSVYHPAQKVRVPLLRPAKPGYTGFWRGAAKSGDRVRSGTSWGPRFPSHVALLARCGQDTDRRVAKTDAALRHPNDDEHLWFGCHGRDGTGERKGRPTSVLDRSLIFW